MPHYIALIHKDADSCYGVSFPDLPGVFTAGDTIDEAMQQAAEVLEVGRELASSEWIKGVPSSLSTNRGPTQNFKKMRPTQ
jgi:predicted RNase H-like HicB family nuclease